MSDGVKAMEENELLDAVASRFDLLEARIINAGAVIGGVAERVDDNERRIAKLEEQHQQVLRDTQAIVAGLNGALQGITQVKTCLGVVHAATKGMG